MAAFTLHVNGRARAVEASPDTPLLYVLRDQLELDAPQFGCGLGQCGACAVLAGGREIRSCQVSVAEAAGQEITTLEGLPALAGPHAKLHPVQQAWIDEQVPQCGYCQNGMLIAAASLLRRNPHPTDAEIRTAMNAHLCRCATYLRILRAVKRAADA